ncbi:cytochrome b [Gilvimarinus polysaccharolyticus]|uniref:cytochrome b n=1 Tax=Gilvimarinus polysaccharolyticus TaxID=863921 RepID=UPI000673C697|nr:cytochrome b [Gilvimarinus polysaccharolyticus]
MLKDTRAGFGFISIAIHWLSALAIVFLFGLGIYMVDLGYYDPWYHKGPTLHVSIGLLLLLVTLARLLWRLCNPKPVALARQNKWQLRAAAALKIVLYSLLLTLLLTGYLVTSAEGKGPELFGWLTFPVFLQINAAQVDIAGFVHRIFGWLIVIFAALHGLAALVHHFIYRDRTLLRMLKPVAKTDSP